MYATARRAARRRTSRASLRIDYVWVDRWNAKAYPAGVAKFDGAPQLFAPAFKNAEVTIYRVQTWDFRLKAEATGDLDLDLDSIYRRCDSARTSATRDEPVARRRSSCLPRGCAGSSRIGTSAIVFPRASIRAVIS